MNKKSTLLTLFVLAIMCALATALMLGQAASSTSAPSAQVAPAPKVSLDPASISGIELVSAEASPSGPSGVVVITFRNATGHPVTGFSFDFGAGPTPGGEYYYKSRAFDSSLDGGSWAVGDTTSVPTSLDSDTTVKVVAIQFLNQKAVGDRRVLSAVQAEHANVAAAYERVLADVRARQARAGANPVARQRELDELRHVARNHSGKSVSGSPGLANVVQGNDAEAYMILGASLDRLAAEAGEEHALEAVAAKLEKAAKRHRGAVAFAAGGVR